MTERRLFLDVGNSSIKAAYIRKGEWVNLHPAGVKNAADFVNWLKKESPAFEELIIASVRKDLSKALEASLKSYKVRELRISDVPSFRIDYKTPETLGVDRYLGCLGASLHAASGVVVIDAGSACTIDYMSPDGVYRGGVIMPGLESLIDIFKDKAPELPPIEVKIPAGWPAKSTQESLQWGQIGFFMDGIKAALRRHKEQFSNYDLYLTGGSANDLYPLLGEGAILRPNLVFEGMLELLREIESN